MIGRRSASIRLRIDNRLEFFGLMKRYQFSKMIRVIQDKKRSYFDILHNFTAFYSILQFDPESLNGNLFF
jgi:hypothetical protein